MHHLTLFHTGSRLHGQAIAELVAKFFKKYYIYNALDSMEDNLLWDDDEDDSDVDDPSSDYLPSDSDDAGEDEDSAWN